MLDHMIGHAAHERSLQALSAVGAHDDEINALIAEADRKTILRGLGATKNSWVAWKVEDDSVFVTGINPDKFTELDIPEHEGMIVLKVIDEMGNYECNKDGDIYVLQVKSQGRLGTRNQVSEILSKAGIKEDDWIIAEYVDSKTDGMGWRLYGLGQKDLLYMLKKKRGETNAEISTT